VELAAVGVGVGEAPGVGVGVGLPATGVGVGVGLELEELTLPHPVKRKIKDRAIDERQAHRADFIWVPVEVAQFCLLLRQQQCEVRLCSTIQGCRMKNEFMHLDFGGPMSVKAIGYRDRRHPVHYCD
jgi:hypothetical protein